MLNADLANRAIGSVETVLPGLSIGFLAALAKGGIHMRDLRVSNSSIGGTGKGLEGKYLTFALDREEYGIGILTVREIIKLMPIRSVPQTPGHVKGVINLRGKVIPVVDLRLKFGMAEVEHTEKTSVIVVDLGQSEHHKATQIGIVVDEVCEVVNIKADEIEPAPAFGSLQDTDYILGMAKVNQLVKILLDINRILGGEGLEDLGSLGFNPD